MSAHNTNGETELADYLHACLGDTQGRLHIAIGYGGHFNGTGRYEFNKFVGSHFAWPGEADQAMREMLVAAPESDVYLCPYLMHADKRTPGGAVARDHVHADIDHGHIEGEVDKIAALHGFAVASGTPGHGQVYVALTEPIPANWHKMLCRGLGDHLGGGDAKISANDVLRPPGTFNHKSAAKDGTPTPVQWLVRPTGVRVDPHALAQALGVTLPDQVSSNAADTSAVGVDVELPVELNIDDYPKVKAALQHLTADRSVDTMRVVAACRACGLTLAQARYAINTRPDLAARLAQRHDDDVAECWRKTADPDDAGWAGDSDDDNADAADNIRAFKFPDGHRPTDVGNANRLLAHAGGRIRYVHAWGKWIVYQGGRWIVDEKDALVTETAKQVAKGLYQLAAKTAATDPDEAKLIWAWALKSDTSGHIAAMIRLARGVHGILVNHEHLDADPWLLNVANGTIDLRTGRLRAHNPADLCTLQAPVVFDPHATAPLWEACVQCWQPDDDVRDYLQVRAGAGATGIPTETVDVDYGHGGNGKSKFHGAIQHVLGPYATVPHKSLLVAGRFEQHATVIADLFRKRIAVASETKAAEALDDEQVKNLTGGDRLKGRRMREDPWEFWPTHTLIMFSNHKPTVRGRDEGIWRRLRLVPWTITIAEDARDEGLALKLRAEAPGILRWIVDGARRFHQAGARLTPPAAVRAATDQYRRDEDVIGRFIGEVLDIGDSRFDWCYSIDIKNELDAWCAEQDIDPVPSMQEITATLQERDCKPGGRKQVHGKRSTIWHGVSIAKQEK